MVCRSCKAIVDDCWRWCPECGGQLAPMIPSSRFDQDYYTVEWMIGTDSEPLYELSS